MTFWFVAIFGFLLIVGLVGLYLSVPIYMMGRSFAGRGAIFHEEILMSAGIAFPIAINAWFAVMAWLD